MNNSLADTFFRRILRLVRARLQGSWILDCPSYWATPCPVICDPQLGAKARSCTPTLYCSTMFLGQSTQISGLWVGLSMRYASSTLCGRRILYVLTDLPASWRLYESHTITASAETQSLKQSFFTICQLKIPIPFDTQNSCGRFWRRVGRRTFRAAGLRTRSHLT